MVRHRAMGSCAGHDHQRERHGQRRAHRPHGHHAGDRQQLPGREHRDVWRKSRHQRRGQSHHRTHRRRKTSRQRAHRWSALPRQTRRVAAKARAHWRCARHGPDASARTGERPQDQRARTRSHHASDGARPPERPAHRQGRPLRQRPPPRSHAQHLQVRCRRSHPPPRQILLRGKVLSPVWYIIIPLYLVCWVLVPAAVVWAIRRWRKSESKFEPPRWRSALALAAFSLGGASALLWVVLALWSIVIRPFPFYDPFLLGCYRVGLLLGLVGFVLGLPGKGKLRWPGCFISFATVFMWFVTASME